MDRLPTSESRRRRSSSPACDEESIRSSTAPSGLLQSVSDRLLIIRAYLGTALLLVWFALVYVFEFVRDTLSAGLRSVWALVLKLVIPPWSATNDYVDALLQGDYREAAAILDPFFCIFGTMDKPCFMKKSWWYNFFWGTPVNKFMTVFCYIPAAILIPTAIGMWTYILTTDPGSALPNYPTMYVTSHPRMIQNQ